MLTLKPSFESVIEQKEQELGLGPTAQQRERSNNVKLENVVRLSNSGTPE